MTFNPGSPEAKRQGCLCNATVNKSGEGAFVSEKGTVRFLINQKCPMHKEPLEAA